MVRSLCRFTATASLLAMVSACSGGGAGTVPQQHRAASGHAAATFTIKWTNPTATASMRRKDTISPAAQSITVFINGKSVATANRGTSPTQQIALDAPVGIDQFLFNVYDQPAAQGHLLGSAQVNQQIIDGAVNNVSAAIQALCTTTNVSISDSEPLSYGTTSQSGLLAPTLQSLILFGPFPTTLAIEPEDVDGDVIIAGTGGTIPFSITNLATGSVVDGSHLQLTGTGVFHQPTASGTLTVAAAGCPQTTVAIQSSPAIYGEAGYNISVQDWFGDQGLAATLQPGDVLVGYDELTSRIIGYNPSTGEVSAYSPTFTTRTSLYSIFPNSVVTWSNYVDGLFGAHWNGSATTFFIFHALTYTNISTGIPTQPVAVAASASSHGPYAYAAASGFARPLYRIDLNARTVVTTTAAPYTVNALAVDDFESAFVSFNNASPYVTSTSLSFSASTSGNFGFDSAAAFGGADFDTGLVYELTSNGVVENSVLGGSPITGSTARFIGTPPQALVVVSAHQE